MDNNHFGGDDYGGGYGNSDYGNTGAGSTGNTSGQPRESYYQDDIAYTGGQNSGSQNAYGGPGQHNSQGQYGGGQYNGSNPYGGGQYGGQPQPFYNQQPFYEEPVSVGQWLLIKIILCIPCVNLVMMLVWAFGTGENKTKQNYFRAHLIFCGIVAVLYVFLIIALVSGGREIPGGIYG